MKLVGELLAGRKDVARSDYDGIPVRAPTHPDMHREPSAVGVRFVTPRGRGTLVLLAGMIRANRPWRFVLGLLSALTAAVATAALANLNNTVWRVASALDAPRLLILTLTSLVAMVVWLMFVHKLWRRAFRAHDQAPGGPVQRNQVVTLLIGVTTLYVGLMACNLITGVLVIPSRPLRATLGHPVGVADHLRLAWFVSSVATVGGAVGSGLESNAAVRAAAYRYQPAPSDDDPGWAPGPPWATHSIIAP